MMETKAELRKQYKERRAALSAAERERLSEQLCDRFFRHMPLSEIRVLHTYLPITRLQEPDTTPILQRLREEYPEIKPVVSRTHWQQRSMEHVFYSDELELAETTHGIPEPVGGMVCDAEKIDAVLIPLLAFDTAGHRLGYGAGFYDRFLATCAPHALRIGLSFFGPHLRPLPETHEYDMQLTHCLTPEGLYTF